MEIKIDEKQVQESIDKSATGAIKQAFEGYNVRSSMEKAVSEAIIPDLIAAAMTEAASGIDMKALTQHIAEEMTRSITRGVQAVIREAMANIILDLWKVPSYDDKAKAKARAKIMASVFGERGESLMTPPESEEF